MELLWWAAVFAAAVLLAAEVTRLGWISDDGLITYRYVTNALHGHGPVFNVGERVQGYTHPLWFLLMTAVAAAYSHPLWDAVVAGAALTIVLVLLIAWVLKREVGPAPSRLLAFGLLLLLLASSDSFLEFQTSGLENSLSNALIAAMLGAVVLVPAPRPAQSALVGSLLVLTRPDLALLVAPLLLVLVWERHRLRDLAGYLAGATPLFLWCALALAYYGGIVPNPAYAKVGIYESTSDAFRQGVAYLSDWVTHEPVAVAGSASLLIAGAVFGRNMRERAWALGVVLFTFYVVAVGGDFMRGRFWVPVFMASGVFGTAVLARRFQEADLKVLVPVAAMLLVAGFCLSLAARPPSGAVNGDGIVTERLFTPGLTLSQYRRQGGFEVPFGQLEAYRYARDFAKVCGPITLSYGAIGYYGYFSGPDVSIIDLLGLTDPYIAKLAKGAIVGRRPGHATKYVPDAYFLARADVTMMYGWEERLRLGDCSLREDALRAGGRSP